MLAFPPYQISNESQGLQQCETSGPAKCWAHIGTMARSAADLRVENNYCLTLVDYHGKHLGDTGLS